MNRPGIRALLPDSEFSQISDRNSQMLCFKHFAADQWFPSLKDKALACIYEISIGNVKKSAVLGAKANKQELAHAVVDQC
jgi:hypothetical protein